jgi:hypothetical protein
MSDFRYVGVSDGGSAKVSVAIRQGDQTIRLALPEDEARKLRNDLARALRDARILNRARRDAWRAIGKLR